MDPVIAALLESIDAQLQILKVQHASIRQRLESLDRTESHRAVESYPDRCADVIPAQCALQNEEACISIGSLADPTKWRCNGCEWEESSAG